MSEAVKRRLMLVNRAVVPPTMERATFIASTAAPDRYNDVVDQGTWMLDNYRMNPVIQVDHCYEVEATVGRAASVDVVAGALTVEVVWGTDPKSQLVAQKVMEGSLSAVSVGFMPGRVTQRSLLPQNDPAYTDGYGYVYYDCELLEVSVVAIPANPEALAQRSMPNINLDELASKLLERMLAAGSLSRPQPQPPKTETPQVKTLKEWFEGN